MEATFEPTIAYGLVCPYTNKLRTDLIFQDRERAEAISKYFGDTEVVSVLIQPCGSFW
jgi:hypothetical protein